MSTTLHPISTEILPVVPPQTITADCAGMRMSLAEFDAHEEWEPGYRYELIQGVLVVNPPPPPSHTNGRNELYFWLRTHQLQHPAGKVIDRITTDFYVYLPTLRRIPDLMLWCGLGREPDYVNDVPTIVAEFVSPGRKNWLRDYREKRDEYLTLGVQEYWVFDRFERTLTVFKPGSSEQVLPGAEIYRTPLLPGFELALAKIFAECTG